MGDGGGEFVGGVLGGGEDGVERWGGGGRGEEAHVVCFVWLFGFLVLCSIGWCWVVVMSLVWWMRRFSEGEMDEGADHVSFYGGDAEGKGIGVWEREICFFWEANATEVWACVH